MDKNSKKFDEIIKNVSLSRMKLHSKFEDFKLAELEDNCNGRMFANWISLIIVSGKAMRITFKVHFNHLDSKKTAKKLYNTDIIEDYQSVDFMKEYCNLTGGFIKKICVENGIPVGISLPVITNGMNEIFLDDIGARYKNIFNNYWKLENSDTIFYCSYKMEIFDVNSLSNILSYEITEDKDKNDDDNFEFL